MQTPGDASIIFLFGRRARPFLPNVIGLALPLCSMRWSAKVLMIGPLFVFGAICCAEISALALARWPASELLWRVNLEWFHAFQETSYVLNAYASCLIAFPLWGLALLGFVRRQPLSLAISSNLNFLYAIFVCCAGYLVDGSWRTSSLPLLSARPNSELALWAILIAASFVSAAASHIYYIRAIGAAA